MAARIIVSAWKANLYQQTALAGTPYLDPRTVDMLTETVRTERTRLARGLFLALDGVQARAEKRVVMQRHPDCPDVNETPVLVLQVVDMVASEGMNPQFSYLTVPFEHESQQKTLTVRKPRLYDMVIQGTLWERDEYPPMQLANRLNELVQEQFVSVLGHNVLVRPDAAIRPEFRANRSNILASQGRWIWSRVPVWFTGSTLATGLPFIGSIIQEIVLDVSVQDGYDSESTEVS
jgi:hypothetical protein